MRDILLFIVICFVIFIRYYHSLPQYENGQKVRLSAKVSTEPVNYQTVQRIGISGLSVYLPKYPIVNYGDWVVIEGTVDENNLEDAVLVEQKISDNVLYKIRNKIILFYKSSLPEPDSSLVSGMTLGSKSSIPKSFYEDLRVSGTLHVVVASGMNVSLVALFLINTFVIFIKRKHALYLALVGVWIYALLAGFDAPIVRAAFMGSIAFYAQAVGRLNTAWRGLIISAIIMLLYKPLWLTDIGFMLSIAATASMLLFEKRIRRLLIKVPSLFREGLSTSLSAQIGVAPIIFVTFGEFNILSPIINSLILWTVPLITIIGMISGVVSLVSFTLAKPLLYLTYPLTQYFVKVINIFI